MPESIKLILDCTLAWVALINPVSKIFIISTLAEKASNHEIRRISIKASIVAGVMLLLFAWIGDAVLRNILHVELYSFKVAGGLVLSFRGFEALNKGVFFEFDENIQLADMSIVPLASPMIAGPAAITATLSFPVRYGILITSAALAVSLLVNLITMLYSRAIAGFLNRINFMGASIRIMGLLVATIGIQMVLDGITDYLAS